MSNIDELAKAIHADNRAAGWWDHDVDPLEKLQLAMTEIAEATEGVRKDLMDDHLPHRKMEEVEMADAMIRLLDFGGAYDLTYADSNSPLVFTQHYNRAKNPVACHGHISLSLGMMMFVVGVDGMDDSGELNIYYSHSLFAIMHHSEQRGFDLFAAIDEKRQYNKQRADHKRENRAKEGGKKY